jgi:cell division protease FtsH
VQIDYDEFVRLIESGSAATVQIGDDQILLTLKSDADADAVRDILGLTTPAPGATPSPEQQFAAGQAQLAPDNIYYTGLVDDPSLTSCCWTTASPSTGHRQHQPDPRVHRHLGGSGAFDVLPDAPVEPEHVRRTGGGLGGIMGVGKSKAKMYDMETATGVTFHDVAGEDEAKESLLEIVDYLHDTEKYQRIGAKQPKGALLVGPRARARHCWPAPWRGRQRCRSSR